MKFHCAVTQCKFHAILTNLNSYKPFVISRWLLWVTAKSQYTKYNEAIEKLNNEDGDS